MFGVTWGKNFGFGNHHDDEDDCDMVNIEYQDVGGNWRLSLVTQNVPWMIRNAMISASSTNNGARVRATDDHGSVIDIL